MIPRVLLAAQEILGRRNAFRDQEYLLADHKQQRNRHLQSEDRSNEAECDSENERKHERDVRKLPRNTIL